MDLILWLGCLMTFSRIIMVQGVTLTDCSKPLGMESKAIPDSQISASSALALYPASAARLKNNGAWCVKGIGDPYITIDLGNVKSIVGLMTQGYTLPDGSPSPLEKYTVAISTSGAIWHSLNISGQVQVFEGNKEVDAVAKVTFSNHILAKYLRVFPIASNGQEVVCVRLEVNGCNKVEPPKVGFPFDKVVTLSGKSFGIPCIVTMQANAAVEWKDKNGNVINQEYRVVKQEAGQLVYRQAVVLNVSVTAERALSLTNLYRCEFKEQQLECYTNLTCVAYYRFNKTLETSKQIPFMIGFDYPKSPSDVRVNKLSYSDCSFQFNRPSLGNFHPDSLHYRVIVNVSGSPLSRLPMATTEIKRSGFTAYTIYEFDISVSILKDKWRTTSFKKIFRSLSESPRVSPIITKVVPSGSTELHVHWKKPDYKPENGVVGSYRLKVVQASYGGKAIPKLGLEPILKDIRNITPKWQQYIVDGLKEWSSYNITIYAYNSDGMTDSKGGAGYGKTAMGRPTAPPRNIKLLGKGARYIEITWDAPNFYGANGEISGYYASCVLKATSGGRKRRQGGGGNIAVAPYKFVNLKPFSVYDVTLAAVTRSGIGVFSPPVTVRTNQGAPSVPRSVILSRDPQHSTWFLVWDPPEEKNGIVTFYVIEIIFKSKKSSYTVKGKTSNMDTKIKTEHGIKVRVRARTVEYGPWSEWVTRVPLPAIPTKKPWRVGPGDGSDENKLLLIIISVFLALILCVMILMVIAFVLYRRRTKEAKKVELEMDPILKAQFDNPHLEKGEREKLVRADSLDRNTDNTGSIEDKAHPPIKAEEFLDYVKKMRENEDERFLTEYKTELMSGKCYPWETAARSENKSKNRYANIAAYDHSRVILKPDSTKRKNETDYFNANHIQGYSPESNTRYIACHGPTEAVTPDFWRLVWQEESNVIVMLTKLEEGRKVKCHQYWPNHGSYKYGQITVTMISTDQTADYFIRTLDLQKGTERRTLRQFHFVSWPDHGVPEFPTSLLSLRRRVRHYHKETAPMIVHCSAGVGRTGCFILIDAMLERIDSDGSVDIFNYLQYMRTRRINMVQTVDQYIFAHDAVLEHILCGDTEISVGDLERRIKELKRGSGMEEEFMIVETTSPDPDSLGNVYKVLLRVGRFVDASYVDGYKQRDAFILCRSPTEDFVDDFWSVVKEKKVHTIVMLNQLEENPKFWKYWPDLHQYDTVGSGTVCLTSEAKNGNIMSRKIKLLDLEKEDEYEVQHFQFLDWPDHGVPNRRNTLLTLMSLVEKSQQQYGNGPILVHCSNGHGRSGTFAAVYNTTERLKVEQLIDVMQCVRAIRLSVPNAVDNLEQYQFVYNMIRTFLEAFATYSNFER